MTHTQFSLSWDSHTKDISGGFSIFQQNGEFVDMTLAADGHFVKVHRVIIALSSPYIKELLSSVPCPHPVLFLNNISYTTLCAILEYVYTGVVYVSMNDLAELKLAAKELHIKGLEEIVIPETVDFDVDNKQNDPENCQDTESNESNMVLDVLDDRISYIQITNITTNEEKSALMSPNTETERVNESMDSSCSYSIEQNNSIIVNNIDETHTESVQTKHNKLLENQRTMSRLQYTVSNQGSLQMILNRYIYYLKHTNRDNTQQWRCVDYLTNKKCPAYVLTKEGDVAVRVAVHTHPFHDKKILKKMRTGTVYSAINEAREQGKGIRRTKNNSEDHDNSE